MRQAAAAVSVRTYWSWERTATLRLHCRRGRLGGARRFGAHGGKRGVGHIVAAARLQLAIIIISSSSSNSSSSSSSSNKSITYYAAAPIG